MVEIRRGTEYRTWLARKMREQRVLRTQLELGGIYTFGYEPVPSKKAEEIKGEQDNLPLVIATRAYPTGILGVNVRAIPQRALRLRLLERYTDAIEGGTSDQMRSLAGISRMVQSQGPTRDSGAYKLFKWKNIKTKVVQVTVEDLRHLIEKVI